MRVNKDVSKTVFSAVPQNPQQHEKQNKNGVFSAENANFNKSAIEQKRERAGKQAAKIMMDAYAQSNKTDRGVQEMHDRIKELNDTIAKDRNLLKDGEIRLQELVDFYEVDPESKEQKDLDFYEELTDRLKEHGITSGFVKNGKFDEMIIEKGYATQEELDRFREIEDGMTDYQKKAHEILEVNKELTKEISESETRAVALARGINEIANDRLKRKPGAEAAEQVDAIMDALSKEIMAMIQNDVKENIDESMAEEEEKGKELKEIKEEKEELLEEQREKRKAEEELLEEALSDFSVISGSIADIDHVQANVNQKIDSMLNKAKLLPEDIKGTNVDELL